MNVKAPPRLMFELRDVLRRLSGAGLERIWERTWGVGGPHNKGPVNRALLAELAASLAATPPDADPAVPAGRALHFLVYRRPFWDCNKRTGWSVCVTIMTATGHAQTLTDEAVNDLVVKVENGELSEAETIDAVRRAFRLYRASKR